MNLKKIIKRIFVSKNIKYQKTLQDHQIFFNQNFWISFYFLKRWFNFVIYFQVSVEVLEFPPLPPSPVEEADEESSDVGNGPISTQPKAKPRQTTRTMDGYRPRVPPHRGISVIDGKDHSQSSLDTRSMDAGYSRGRRTNMGSSSRREVRSIFIHVRSSA